MPLNILGPGESSIYVDDLDRAEEWYNEVLKLDTVFKNQGLCFLDTGNTGPARGYIALFDPAYTEHQESPPSHSTHGEDHFALDIPLEDLEDWRRHLETLDGYDIEIEDDRTWGRDRSIYFRDPFDNSLELYGVGASSADH